MADKAKFNIQSVSQNRREVSCWRLCTASNSLHLHREDGLRFNNSKNCKNSNSKNHIMRLLSPRFLVVAFFVVRAEYQAAVIRFAWKPKNDPRRDVRRNDVGWSLVATSLLGNSGYQRDLWPKQNCTSLAILVQQNCKLASLAAFFWIGRSRYHR